MTFQQEADTGPQSFLCKYKIPKALKNRRLFVRAGTKLIGGGGAKPVLTFTGSECLPVTITSAVCVFVSLEFGFNFTLENI